MTLQLTEISDVVEVGQEELVSLRSPRDLYTRWERQHWSVEQLAAGGERERWLGLRRFVRDELCGTMAELHDGEVCVTETLTPLIDFAPRPEQRLYLATQIADEARHVRFFETYLAEVVGSEWGSGQRAAAGSPYSVVFEPALRQATLAVRERPGDPGSWYTAIVYYHLVTEGILAATALRSTLELLRAMDSLPVLSEGIVNVARDESRHMSFGLGSAREGVRRGYGDRVAEAYLHAIGLAAQVLVGPDRHTPRPIFAVARAARARQFEGQWTFARTKMRRNLRVAGLGFIEAEACADWDAACTQALDAYASQWGEEHPARGATPVGSTNQE